MEALTAFGVNWKLLLIQGVNFALLLLILHRFLYRPLFALLEKRQRVIEKGLEDARRSAEEMQKIETEKSGILAAARTEGGQLMEEFRRDALAEKKSIVEDAQQKSAEIFSETRKNADAEREHLLRESEKELAKMAVLASEKILRGGHSSSVARR